MSEQLPRSWERLEPEIDGGLPAYHAPKQDPAPYAKIYDAPYAEEYNYVAIVYPHGTDIETYTVCAETDTPEDAEKAIVEWIEANATCDPAK